VHDGLVTNFAAFFVRNSALPHPIILRRAAGGARSAAVEREHAFGRVVGQYPAARALPKRLKDGPGLGDRRRLCGTIDAVCRYGQILARGPVTERRKTSFASSTPVHTRIEPLVERHGPEENRHRWPASSESGSSSTTYGAMR
jgi:hypothetical protein